MPFVKLAASAFHTHVAAFPSRFLSLFQGGPQLEAHERGAWVSAGADGPLGVPAGQHDGRGGGLGEAQPQVRPALRQEGFRALVRV